MYYIMMTARETIWAAFMIAILILVLSIMPNICPNRLEKTMYFCPISIQNRCKYIRTEYLLKVGFSILLSGGVFLVTGLWKSAEGMVSIGGLVLYIIITNVHMDSYILSCYAMVYKSAYGVLKISAMVLLVIALILADAATEDGEVYAAAVILAIAVCLAVPVVCTFWTRICKLTADYEMTYGMNGGKR